MHSKDSFDGLLRKRKKNDEHTIRLTIRAFSASAQFGQNKDKTQKIK